MTIKQNNQLTNFHRLLVLSLSLIGLSLDGVQTADLFFIAASIIWLWMINVMRWEVKLFNQSISAEIENRKNP